MYHDWDGHYAEEDVAVPGELQRGRVTELWEHVKGATRNNECRRGCLRAEFQAKKIPISVGILFAERADMPTSPANMVVVTGLEPVTPSL